MSKKILIIEDEPNIKVIMIFAQMFQHHLTRKTPSKNHINPLLRILVIGPQTRGAEMLAIDL